MSSSVDAGQQRHRTQVEVSIGQREGKSNGAYEKHIANKISRNCLFQRRQIHPKGSVLPNSIYKKLSAIRTALENLAY